MNASPENSTPWVVDTTAERFELDVVERSRLTPVVVDFWAAWCQPCRMLAPLLEKLAAEYGGRVVVVRANTDELPHIAAQFNIQSIPTVFALVDGEVVDYFQGVMPEAQLRQWLDRVLSAATLSDARAQEQSAPDTAERLYRQILDQTPGRPEALMGLARLLLQQQRLDESRACIDELAKRGFLEAEAEKVKAALDLQQQDAGDIAHLRQAAADAPDDLERQLQLAKALAGQQVFEESLEICLKLVERDRQGVGDQARLLMIDVFRVLPADSDITRTYRRRLSSLLF
jgi:putative thioredoxin